MSHKIITFVITEKHLFLNNLIMLWSLLYVIMAFAMMLGLNPFCQNFPLRISFLLQFKGNNYSFYIYTLTPFCQLKGTLCTTLKLFQLNALMIVIVSTLYNTKRLKWFDIFQQGTLKHYEKELISFFSDDPNAVMISNVPSR